MILNTNIVLVDWRNKKVIINRLVDAAVAVFICFNDLFICPLPHVLRFVKTRAKEMDIDIEAVQSDEIKANKIQKKKKIR